MQKYIVSISLNLCTHRVLQLINEALFVIIIYYECI